MTAIQSGVALRWPPYSKLGHYREEGLTALFLICANQWECGRLVLSSHLDGNLQFLVAAHQDHIYKFIRYGAQNSRS
ncbi:MAG: hypothetical protein QOE77_723 [Blastocatellia bacterium]|nr:hypothetical protein [Blastocatellia bacterium]